MIILLLFLLIPSIGINATHFNGGTITWARTDPYTNSSSVGITITQIYSWSYPTVSCNTGVPVSSGYGNANLACIANCSTDGGYSNAPVDILTDCTYYSSTLGMMSSERSVNITLNTGAYFYLAYKGSAWRNLYTNSKSGLGWSVVALIDLRLRPDGIINSAPVVNILSPQYIFVNTTTLIDIPVSDFNTGDDVRCRWAVNEVNGSFKECSEICYPGGLPNDTTLSNCTISLTGLISNVWYPIALQVEDFINKTSTVPMSSVPVQFLIYVQATPACTILPVIVSLTDCLEVQVGVTTNFTLYIENLCNSSATITEVMITEKISGMTAGSVKNSTTNTLSYIQLTWTPQSSQIGTQKLCAYAHNSLLVRSKQYCVTFTVTTSSPNCPVATGAAGRRRRRGPQMEERIEQRKYSQLLPSFVTRNLSFDIFNNNYLFRKVSNNRDNTSIRRLSFQTSLLSTPKNRVWFTDSGNNRNHNIDQSFAKESARYNVSDRHNNNVTEVLRNQLSTVGNHAQLNNSQRKDRSNTITTTNNISRNITTEDANASIYYNEPMSVIKLNGDGTPIVRKHQIIRVNRPMTVARQRSRSINRWIDSQPVTGGPSSRIGSVTITRVRSLSKNSKPNKNNETTKVHEGDGEHTNNKINVTSVIRKKSKNRSH
ncbi:unnamed protein product [Rotaria sordida]|uniref:Uncharacterized protein n=1 Tax=Rotaria sordida TaxID=392033 RepID=A0A819B6T1_9BILA|nr:unnamed protein product [Rotaria sordida]CAF3791669.1 unnamed protein product [Rotaria sordida]